MNDDYQLNLRKLYERGCRLQPDNEIVTQTDLGCHRITYHKLQARSTRLASALSKLGISPGDTVSSFMWNNARHFMLYYALPAMGAVLQPMNIRLHPNELSYIIQHSQSRAIFVDADILPLLEAVPPAAFATVKLVVVCGENMRSGGWRSKFKNAVDFEQFEATGSPTMDWPDLDERSAMALCYTSGTTGNPKGVAYSHRSTYLMTMAAMGADSQGLKGYDCICPIVPMFHAVAWGYPFLAMTMGLKVLLLHNTKDWPFVLDLCLDEECNLIAGVPTVMQAFREALTANPSKYAKLRGTLTRAICGGSAPPAELIEWYHHQWGIELIQAWGMTETNPVGTLARRVATRRDLDVKDPAELTRNQQTCGLPLPLVELKVVDPDDLDRERPHDGESSGELLAKGPWVTNRYFGGSGTDKFHDGWLLTGDIAAITEREQLVIKDRSKDMIKSGGEWISSVDMENLVVALPEVAMAAVVAVPHPKWAERPVVVCTLQSGGGDLKAMKQKVLEHLVESGRFSKFQIPDDVLFWDEIPVTGTGKISKKMIREKLKKEGYVLPSIKRSKL